MSLQKQLLKFLQTDEKFPCSEIWLKTGERNIHFWICGTTENNKIMSVEGICPKNTEEIGWRYLSTTNIQTYDNSNYDIIKTEKCFEGFKCIAIAM